MKIGKDKAVAIHYVLTDKDGNELDSSRGKEPLEYVHGRGMLIPGLEAMLEGKEPGASFRAVVEPEEAYGAYNKNLVAEVPRSQFETDEAIEIGMSFHAGTEDGGSLLVRVVGITDDVITVDGNHELAGKQLTFQIEVVDVRDASDEELERLGGCGSCAGNCGSCGGGSDSCGCGSCGDSADGCGCGGCC